MKRSSTLLEIYRQVLEAIESGGSFAFATVLEAGGSTPQRTGVKALIRDNGTIVGTLGGGLLEAETIRSAVEACGSNLPHIRDFQLNEDYHRNAGPICGGSMRILVDPTAKVNRQVVSQVLEALENHQRGILLTRIHHSNSLGVRMEWYPEETLPISLPSLGEEITSNCLEEGGPKLCTGQTLESEGWDEILVEPVIPNATLLIVGGGHVGQATAHLATWNGFDVTVLDDRPEFTDPALFPEGTKLWCADIPASVAEFPIDRETYIVLVNRGHKQDAETLEACIHSDATYIGMIGSERKVSLVRKDFLESGIANEEEFDRVQAPIGLDIGAVTVPEIATSIVAQLISVRRKRNVPEPNAEKVVR